MGLGIQLKEWVDETGSPGSDNPDAWMLAEATDIGIITAVTLLEVPLTPSVPEARKKLPSDSGERSQYVLATYDKWRSQIVRRLTSNDYLLAHYLAGEGIANIKFILSVPDDIKPNLPELINKVGAKANQLMASSHIELTKSLHEQWLKIIDELAARKLSPQQKTTLRIQLELWFDEFSANAREQSR